MALFHHSLGFDVGSVGSPELDGARAGIGRNGFHQLFHLAKARPTVEEPIEVQRFLA